MTQPAIKFRDGTVQVTVWRNTGERGTYYTVNLTRSFRKGDDAWRNTDSLGHDDLLAAAELLREAYVWIRNQKRADAAGKKQSDNVTAK